jgi:hypothetical protein
MRLRASRTAVPAGLAHRNLPVRERTQQYAWYRKRAREFAFCRHSGSRHIDCSKPLSRPLLVEDRKEIPMGKYFLAWLLGVPAGLLIIIYAVTHL